MIKVKVYDVGAPYPMHPTPVLWLTDEREEMVLVLSIGMPEAIAIKSQITDEPPPPRPMTHDLLKSVFEHFNATISRVVITELRAQRYYVAEIHAEANGHRITIDSRPTDAIALALRVNAPIYVVDEVMQEAGQPMPKQAEEGIEASEMVADTVEESAPKAADQAETPLEAAKRRLQAAIDEERYEEAAKIRDEIRKMEE